MHTHLEQGAADTVAPGEQSGVQCLAQGSHLSREQFLPEPRFEPTTLGYKSDALSIRATAALIMCAVMNQIFICISRKFYSIRKTVEHGKHQARLYGRFAPIWTVAINVLTLLTLDFSIIANISWNCDTQENPNNNLDSILYIFTNTVVLTHTSIKLNNMLAEVNKYIYY